MTKTEFNKQLKKNFTKVPNNIILNNEYKLSDLERMTLIRMIQKNNDTKNISYVSIQSLSLYLYGIDGKTQRTNISRILHHLEEKGLINIHTSRQYHKQHKNVIQVNSYALNKKKYSENYLKIPNQLMDSTEYNWKEKLFTMQLYSVIWNDSDRIALTNGQIAKKLNTSRPTINQRIKKFVKKGLIQINKSDHQINISELMQMDDNVSIQPTPQKATKETLIEHIDMKTSNSTGNGKKGLKKASNEQKPEILSDDYLDAYNEAVSLGVLQKGETITSCEEYDEVIMEIHLMRKKMRKEKQEREDKSHNNEEIWESYSVGK